MARLKADGTFTSLTPEGETKKFISKTLDLFAPNLYYFMPVQRMEGERSVDYIGCFYTRAFAIEAKAPGKTPTAKQEITLKAMEAAGCMTFRIDSEECADYRRMRGWLKAIWRLHNHER